MAVISMKALLEAGVHFGHQTKRWNPKMKKYIFTERNGIHVIDLQQTSNQIDSAYAIIKELSQENKKILFVGTKRQAQDSVKSEADRCGMFYINHRWLGGTLTNYKTIKKRIDILEEITYMEENDVFKALPKKEVISLMKEKDKLEKFLGGIKDMNGLPDALFVIDPKKEKNAVREARILGIPIIGIADTNCDPDEIDVVIAANDDAIRAIKLIVGRMADAVIEGQQGDDFVSDNKEETTENVVEDVETNSAEEVTE